MKRINKKSRLLAFSAFALVLGAVSLKPILSYAAEISTETALPGEQFVNAIRAATLAKPGLVLEVEADTEEGVQLCEVEILATDGKKYEVAVEAKTGKVVEVTLDTDEDEKDEEKEAKEDSKDLKEDGKDLKGADKADKEGQ
jgi:hypothetical protein